MFDNSSYGIEARQTVCFTNLASLPSTPKNHTGSSRLFLDVHPLTLVIQDLVSCNRPDLYETARNLAFVIENTIWQTKMCFRVFFYSSLPSSLVSACWTHGLTMVYIFQSLHKILKWNKALVDNIIWNDFVLGSAIWQKRHFVPFTLFIFDPCQFLSSHTDYSARGYA